MPEPLKDEKPAEPRTHDLPVPTRRIQCRIVRKVGDQVTQVRPTKKVKSNWDFFKDGKAEYIIDTTKHIIWNLNTKLGFLPFYEPTLYYEINKENPIGLNKPDYYADAKIGAELNRRKGLISLLQKLDFLMLVGMVVAIIGMVAMAGLAIYNQTQNNTTQRENAALKVQITGLESENALLRGQLNLAAPGQ